MSNGKYKYLTNNISLGSGSLAAMAVFEAGWKPNMSEEAGKKLVRDAIAAGIFNDLGSGSNVDLCVIRNTGPAQYLRTYEEANVKVSVAVLCLSNSQPFLPTFPQFSIFSWVIHHRQQFFASWVT